MAAKSEQKAEAKDLNGIMRTGMVIANRFPQILDHLCESGEIERVIGATELSAGDLRIALSIGEGVFYKLNAGRAAIVQPHEQPAQ